MLQHQKFNEHVLQRQVDVLTDVWQIDKDEVTLGYDDAGGSGVSRVVYRRFYRNIIVALKK